jgi:tripartite-type tricarboxylate transporter receptor subunit TctC
MRPVRCALALIAALVGAGLGTAAAAAAEPVETFYASKRIKIVVGAPVGGGYDLYSRLLARHIGKHIPGQPGVFVVNMPGAVSVNAANYLAHIAPQDGTELVTVVQTVPMAQVARGIGVRFDLARSIGSAASATMPTCSSPGTRPACGRCRTCRSAHSWSAPPTRRRSEQFIRRS